MQSDTDQQLPIHDWLLEIQNNLFVAQAQIAGADKLINVSHVTRLEQIISDVERLLQPQNSFVISGATQLSAMLDVSRAVARRAERSAIESNATAIQLHMYLNRLSSVLYALARYTAQTSGTKEVAPSYE